MQRVKIETTASATLILAPAVAFLLYLFLPSSAAIANNGPHGNYSALTDKCAGCHRTHTAGAAKLLITDVPALCFTCHGGGASGANTNVVDGRYAPTGSPLNAGGFTTFQGVGTTSSHSIDRSQQAAWGSDTPWPSSTGCLGCHSDVSGMRWPGAAEFFPGVGNQPGQIAGAGNVRMALTCTSCHDAHGARSYRLLNNRVMPEAVEYQDPTLPGYVQVVSNETGGLNPDQPGYVADYTTPRYRDGINSWCASCHYLYLQTQSSWAFDAFDGKGAQIRYRHSILTTAPSSAGLTTNLPLQQPAGYSATQQATDKLGCITCHYAHGTNATVGGYAASVAPSNDSALLRMNNRGVCEDCHKK